MTLNRLLETFEPAVPGRSRSPASQDESERIDAARSEGFEAGYASGWEDATRAEGEARHRVDAEFERNIQNLAFTYNEAVDRVRAELKTFVAALIDGFFPALAPDLVREHVRAELLKVADDLIDVPIEIVASPDCAPLLAQMLENDFALRIELVEDVALASNQVFLRITGREIEIDIDPLLVALRKQFDAVSQPDQPRNAHDSL